MRYQGSITGAHYALNYSGDVLATRRDARTGLRSAYDEQSHHDGGVVLNLHGFPFGGRLHDHEALGG
jgi:hypothetical protein